MPETLTMTPPKLNPNPIDRPAWIPPEITHDWDPNPYAYQTEEELMPAGGEHGQRLTYIMEVVRHVIEGKGLMLLVDTFMLYRDAQGKKRRISPDLILMPYRQEAPIAYDLDSEVPPSCVVEVTSQKSHMKDLQDNVALYFGLGIKTYLVIDAVTPQGKARPQIELHLWRVIRGRVQKISADADGYLTLPEMELKIQARGRRIIFADAITDEVLFDSRDFTTALAAEQEARLAEQEARQAAEEAHLVEQEARLAEQEARQAAEEALHVEQAARRAAEASLAEAQKTRSEEIALTMWQKGLDVALITEMTGISEHVLRELGEIREQGPED